MRCPDCGNSDLRIIVQRASLVTFECLKCRTRISTHNDGLYFKLQRPYHRNLWRKIDKKDDKVKVIFT